MWHLWGSVYEEKMFLEILQNSQENTCAGVFFYIANLHSVVFLKNKLRRRCF